MGIGFMLPVVQGFPSHADGDMARYPFAEFFRGKRRGGGSRANNKKTIKDGLPQLSHKENSFTPSGLVRLEVNPVQDPGIIIIDQVAIGVGGYLTGICI